MMQQDLFSTPHKREWHLDHQSDVTLTTDFLDAERAKQYFHTLQEQLQWEQSEILLAGRYINIPRLNAWYGDSAAHYQYSGAVFTPRPWTAELSAMRDAVQQITGQRFNSVLANLYRDGQDSVAWHADDERELGQNPVIASLSLGETRRFMLRPKDRTLTERIEIKLPHNSLLVMSGGLQHHWLHQVPKSSVPKGPRLNLTFRLVNERD